MNKRSLFQMVSVAVVLSCAAGHLQAKDKPINWRLQSNLNSGEPGFVAVQEKFAKLATEMSGGRINFEVFPVGALFPVKDGLEAVAAGVTEMALLTGGYYAGKIGPFANLESGVPGSLRSSIERYTFFYKKGFLELAREAYDKHGVYYLGPQLSSGWDIMAKKPIVSMADFKGLKIRAFGLEAKWYEKMGASPVFLGGGEIYSGLATGVIDAARWSSPAGNLNNAFHEVAKYYVQPSPMPAPNNFFAVNAQAWKGLPDDIKAVLQQAAVAASMEYIALSLMQDAAAMQKMEAAGVQVSQIPADEFSKMESEARELWREYESAGGEAAKGVKLLNEFLSELGR